MRNQKGDGDSRGSRAQDTLLLPLLSLRMPPEALIAEPSSESFGTWITGGVPSSGVKTLMGANAIDDRRGFLLEGFELGDDAGRNIFSSCGCRAVSGAAGAAGGGDAVGTVFLTSTAAMDRRFAPRVATILLCGGLKGRAAQNKTFEIRQAQVTKPNAAHPTPTHTSTITEWHLHLRVLHVLFRARE